ncbi:MAG: DTW domain-containing protein [Verrucomicrobia bacterium]|nr:DTW domain-containing protein [Verrucomicrobiota bacterium]
MRSELCICAAIDECRAATSPRTHVVILMHQRERVRTTNTARLAQLTIPGCEIRVRGLKDAPLSLEGLGGTSRQPLLLFPTEDAVELNESFVRQLTQPVQLIVPDGTWGQAAKVTKREPGLAGVPRVKLPTGSPTQYGLRRSTKPEGLATFEAIARALGILEGGELQKRLEAVFLLMVERTLRSRGGACHTPL